MFLELSLLRYEIGFFLPGEVRVSCQHGNQPLPGRYRSAPIRWIAAPACSPDNLRRRGLKPPFFTRLSKTVALFCMLVLRKSLHTGALLSEWNSWASLLEQGLKEGAGNGKQIKQLLSHFDRGSGAFALLLKWRWVGSWVRKFSSWPFRAEEAHCML